MNEKTMTVVAVAGVLGNSSDCLRKNSKRVVPRALDMKVQSENAVTEIEKDETILVLFNKVWYNRLCGESALYTSSRPFNL